MSNSTPFARITRKISTENRMEGQRRMLTATTVPEKSGHVTRAVDLLHEQHGRDDRPWTGEQPAVFTSADVRPQAAEPEPGSLARGKRPPGSSSAMAKLKAPVCERMG